MSDIKFHFRSKKLHLPYKKGIPIFGDILYSNQFFACQIVDTELLFSTLPSLHQGPLENLVYFAKEFFQHFSFNFTNVDYSQPFFNTIVSEELNKSTFFTDRFFLNGERLFIIESLLLSYLKNERLNIKNNFLISPPYPEIASIKNAIELNDFILKVKIGYFKNSFSEISQFLKSVVFNLPKVLIRLDANRSFSLEEFYLLISILEKTDRLILPAIDYFEEPLRKFNDVLLITNQKIKDKIAFDENAKFFIHKNSWNHAFLKNPLVIKPSLWGFSPIIQLKRQHPTKRIILSSAFEHPTVMSTLHFLASFFPDEHHGLESLF